MKLLVFGSLNIDHVYCLPHFVREGETVSSEHYSRNEGGKGFNQAVALAKAGQKVWMAGAVGADGLFLKGYLEKVGVNTEHIRRLDAPTGHAIIQVDAGGSNSIILYGGANRLITSEMIADVLQGFSTGDYVLMQNEISNGDLLLRMAKERGMHVILNPSPVSDALTQWRLELVDWFILNEIEGKDLTGKENPDEILDALLSRYPSSKIVLTLGADGSVYADRAERLRQPCIHTRAVDTTAAGDTFTGYFFQAVLSYMSIPDALLRASRAAAAAVSRSGAASSIPFADEI